MQPDDKVPTRLLDDSTAIKAPTGRYEGPSTPATIASTTSPDAARSASTGSRLGGLVVSISDCKMRAQSIVRNSSRIGLAAVHQFGWSQSVKSAEVNHREIGARSMQAATCMSWSSECGLEVPNDLSATGCQTLSPWRHYWRSLVGQLWVGRWPA
jgi:hypothetical protein